jgi:hypothetical protein
VSHAISVELQKEDENIYTSKNTAAASRVHKMDAAKNVKSHQLKSQCSSEHGGNVQQTEGLRVTNNVPFSEALVHQSKSLEKSSDSSKTSFRNRRLYSSADSPELIELKDYDDISNACNVLFTPSLRGTKKMIFTSRKSNLNETPIKKLKDDNKRRKTESVSACHEQDQLGVTVAGFGRLSQTAKLVVSKPCRSSTKGFSGRWRKKYLEEVRKRNLDEKCRDKVQHSVHSSVYSDFDETDSDSDLSWKEPEKSFVTHSSSRTKKIILTNRKSNVNKTPIKQLQIYNREIRKTESVSACHEQDQLGVTVSRFGRLSQTAKLDVSKPCRFSKNVLSGRWHNKCLEEERKRKLEKKYKENVQHSVHSSVFSDIGQTDSDSDPSWKEDGKPKILKVCQKTEVTYGKRRRTTFRSKEKKEEVIPPRNYGRNADVLQVSSNNCYLTVHKSVTLLKIEREFPVLTLPLVG